MTAREIVRNGDVAIEVLVEGAGPTVVMVASLGRGAEDFDDLATRVAAAGYRALRPQPRGIGATTGPMEGVSLDDLATDVVAVIDALGDAPAVLIGHAFGNRLSRNTARLYPEKVRKLALLACGGQIPITPEMTADLLSCFDTSKDDATHMGHVSRAFFAEGNDAAVWRDGWFAATAVMQSTAVRNSDHAAWKLAGGQPMLVVQALQDAIAPPANAEALAKAAPQQVRVVEIDHAGHAMLPEQPDAIAEAVLGFLRED
ncbi:Putative aminoacrylate hydrolase RutD [Alphaproteobacteria bacterium SO-S41]|nr:Putative aminoacrylate hydrolase RutD [Alphaproteobacteria bacterium SO-S41]